MAGKEHSAKDKAAVYNQATFIAFVLAILTGAEAYMATNDALNSPVFLFIVAFIKAALVVYFFMHVYRLWREDGH